MTNFMRRLPSSIGFDTIFPKEDQWACKRHYERIGIMRLDTATGNKPAYYDNIIGRFVPESTTPTEDAVWSKAVRWAYRQDAHPVRAWFQALKAKLVSQ